MLSDDQIEALRAQHGRIKYVTFNGTDLVFRKPTRLDIKAHAMAGDDPFADEQLARRLVVHPSREAFAALIEEYPYLVKNKDVAFALAKLTGVLQDEESKSSGSSANGSAVPLATTPEA